LTDTSTCPPTSGIFSATASTDEELMAVRDWFIYTDGRLDAGMGAVLASLDGTGTFRILLVNRNSSERTVIVELDGSAATPSTIYAFDGTDDPLDPLRTVVSTGPRVVMTTNSLMVLVF
jgi:hypothetical protein